MHFFLLPMTKNADRKSTYISETRLTHPYSSYPT